MNKNEFIKLSIMEKVNYINNQLEQGQTVIRIREDLGLGEKTLQKEMKVNGYKYFAKTRKYEMVTDVVINESYKSNDIVVESENYKSNDIVVNKGEYIRLKTVLDVQESINAKMEEMYQWYELQRNVIEIDKNELKIEPNKGNAVSRSFKVYEDVIEKFSNFSRNNNNYKVQDLISKALDEFVDKYS
ncbi:hypothetical protein [Clostridium sp.]|uniref:hypothetical protein n=1 Tax=Clostridium sp. TaxID=1506 RepID=UPI00303BE8C1